jgi:hypothetical protein
MPKTRRQVRYLRCTHLSSGTVFDGHGAGNVCLSGRVLHGISLEVRYLITGQICTSLGFIGLIDRDVGTSILNGLTVVARVGLGLADVSGGRHCHCILPRLLRMSVCKPIGDERKRISFQSTIRLRR